MALLSPKVTQLTVTPACLRQVSVASPPGPVVAEVWCTRWPSAVSVLPCAKARPDSAREEAAPAANRPKRRRESEVGNFDIAFLRICYARISLVQTGSSGCT